MAKQSISASGKKLYPFLILMLVLILQSCSGASSTGYNLTIAHLNDTHSHLESVPLNLNINGAIITAQAGGFARLQTLVNEMRGKDPNLLLLHAGDAVQGTLYFTLFGGEVEFDFLNRLGVTAMTFGNHEFDRGPAAIPRFLDRAKFPFISSNIDFSREPEIARRVMRSVVREVNGERVGIFGLTTETTPQSALNVGRARFLDVVPVARRQVAEFEEEGINKIIALTHLGSEEDIRLAEAVNGIDVIVGGHSHTLQGDPVKLGVIGLSPERPYPTLVSTPDGGKTLVLQAWQWGDMLGNLRVTFDEAGRIRGYVSGAVIPVGDSFSINGAAVKPGAPYYPEISRALQSTGVVRVVAEDRETTAALAPYSAQMELFRTTPVATAAEVLRRSINGGPGVLGADSMLAAAPKAQLALLNYGAVRRDLTAGVISVSDTLEVMPFGNTLVLVDLTGEELKNALEEDIDFLQAKYGRNSTKLPYIAGISLEVAPSNPRGNRIVSIRIKEGEGVWRAIDTLSTYHAVVNSFVANGGDGFSPIKKSRGFRHDTGIIDNDAFRDYLKSLGTVRNPKEQRIRLIATPEATVAQSRSADNYTGHTTRPAPMTVNQ